MRHARPDYERFQDPAGHPDIHIHEFIGKLADAFEAEDRQEAINTAVMNFFGANPERARLRLAAARAFADRIGLAVGGSPIGKDEPVFLIRGKDAAAVEAVEAYARAADARGGSTIAVEARRWAREIRRWQEVNGSKVPDLPGEKAS